MRGWEQFQSVVQQSGAAVALLLNFVLIGLILNVSPRELGEYKYLMMFISAFEMVYAVLDVIVQPIFHSFGSTFMLIVNPGSSRWDKKVWEVLASVYCGFFGSSMAIFSLHFIYRYWVISGNSKKLNSFKGWKVLVWLSIPIANGFVWALVGFFLCSPRKSSADYLRNSVLETLDLNLDDIMYFAPYFYEKSESGEENIYYPSFFGIIADSLSIDISLSVAALYGIKCWRRMRVVFRDPATSSHYRALQSQLFYALVTQTLIPVILMHLPALAMFTLAFFGMDPGSLSGIVSITIALFPALDPLPTILIIRNYRKAVRSFISALLFKTKCSNRESRSQRSKFTII